MPLPPTGFDPNYMAAMGANYRLNADLADDPPGLWAVDAAGQSGQPGSPNYCDQLSEWLVNRKHYLTLPPTGSPPLFSRSKISPRPDR